MPPDSAIIQAAAAEFIRDRHRLGAFVNGLLRDAHATEDVLQEVWVRLAAEVGQGTVIENQPAWCRGVARNLIRKLWEKRQNARVVADSAALEEFIDRVEESFAATDAEEHAAMARVAALDECVSALPERSRHLIALKYTRHMPVEAMAAEIGQSFEAVKKALFRIRAALVDCVQRKLKQEELSA